MSNTARNSNDCEYKTIVVNGPQELLEYRVVEVVIAHVPEAERGEYGENAVDKTEGGEEEELEAETLVDFVRHVATDIVEDSKSIDCQFISGCTCAVDFVLPVRH